MKNMTAALRPNADMDRLEAYPGPLCLTAPAVRSVSGARALRSNRGGPPQAPSC